MGTEKIRCYLDRVGYVLNLQAISIGTLPHAN